MRQRTLLLLSILGLAFTLRQTEWLLLIAIYTTANYAILFFLTAGERKKKYFMFAVALNAAILIPLKIFHAQLGISAIFGLSFLAFQVISLLIDTSKDKDSRSPPFISYLLYLLYLPKFFTGPIERYGPFSRQVSAPYQPPTKQILLEGMYLLFYGAFKCLLLAPDIKSTTDPLLHHSVPSGLIETILLINLCALQIYCQFSGYVDIARFVSLTLGVELTKNFNSPFLSANPQDFWQRWHISLSHWLRDYIFYPLLHKTRNVYFSVFLTIFLMGIWHGPEWRFFWSGFFSALGVLVYLLAQPYTIRLELRSPPIVKKVLFFIFQFINVQYLCIGLFLLLVPGMHYINEIFYNIIHPSRSNAELQLFLRVLFFAFPVFFSEIFLSWKYGDEKRLDAKGLAFISMVLFYFTCLILLFNADQATQHVEFLYFQF